MKINVSSSRFCKNHIENFLIQVLDTKSFRFLLELTTRLKKGIYPELMSSKL